MPEIADTAGRWSLGLRGWWSQAANLSAVAVVCGLLYLHQVEASKLAREDRALFREAVSTLREGQDRQWQATRSLGGSIKRLDERIEKLEGRPR